MGWGRTLLLGEIGNRLDIDDVERNLACIRTEIEAMFRADMSQDDAIKTLIEEHATLKLYLAALIRLLLQKGTIHKNELSMIVNAIDAEDGSVDGKFSGDIV